MENRDSFFKGNEKKYFIIALIPFIIVFLGLVIYSHINRDIEFRNDLLNENFSHKVVNVFYDKTNHNSSTFVTSKGEIFLNEYSAILNDSIVKHKSDSFIYIYRKDSVIKYNLLQMYRETGWYRD